MHLNHSLLWATAMSDGRALAFSISFTQKRPVSVQMFVHTCFCTQQWRAETVAFSIPHTSLCMVLPCMFNAASCKCCVSLLPLRRRCRQSWCAALSQTAVGYVNPISHSKEWGSERGTATQSALTE